MTKVDWKSVVIALLVLIVIARARQIAEFFSTFQGGDILTLTPLRDSSVEGRFVVTLGILALIFITIFCLLLLNKRK